jgi:hypothetical protein
VGGLVKAVLVTLRPYNPATSARVTLRVTNVNDARVTLVESGAEYLPVLTSGPTIARSVFDGAFLTSGSAPESTLSVTLDEGSLHEWMSYVWGDAEVVIRTGNIGDAFASYAVRWTVNAVSIERQSGIVATIRLRPPARLNRPILYQSFAGTDDGDSGDTGEGTAAVKGVLKPWLSGNARYVRPVLIDPARQIYCYHGYGPTGGATEAFEGGATLGSPDYTWGSYTAMRDQVMTAGQWGHCPSIGMVRFGGQPSFPVTIHAGGDKPGASVLTTTADILKRILEGPGGITAPAIPASNVTALNSSRSQAIDFYLTDQTSVEDLLTEVMLAANGYWMENEDGQIILGLLPPALSGSPSREINLDGRPTATGTQPAVISGSEEESGVPIYRLRLGGRKTHYPHAANDVVASIAAVQASVDEKAFVYPPSSSPPSSPAPTEGDLWIDTSSGVAVLRRYTSGAWVRSAGNNVSYSSSAPGSPSNGDVWVDTSTTPHVTKVRISGAWQIAANHVTEGSQIGVANNAGTTLTLVHQGTASALTQVGNTVTQTSGPASYSQSVYSAQRFDGAAACSFRLPSGGAVVGLDSSPSASSNYTNIDYGLHRNASNNVFAFENGVQSAQLASGATDSSIFTITYDGVNVRYYMGSTLLRTVAASAGLGLQFQASFAAVGAAVGDILLWPFADHAWSNIAGADRPEDNADVTKNAQIAVSIQTEVIINADHTGAVIAGQLPRVLTPTVTRGGVDVRTDAISAYALQNVSSSLSGKVTVNNTGGSADKGKVTLDNTITASGTFQLVATVNSVAQPPITVAVTKVNAAPPVSSTKTASATSGAVPTTTSFVEVVKFTGMGKASGETIRCYFSSDYMSNDGNTVTVNAKWQHSPAGAGTWTDFASAVTGQPAGWSSTEFGPIPFPGGITANQTASPSDGTYDIRLVASLDVTASISWGGWSGNNFSASVSIAT